jgi:site-specific DNA-cytosine methylase
MGFLRSFGRLGEECARFENAGGVDIDEESCLDFERLTGGKATRADVSQMTPADLRGARGAQAPDCVFLSPPCKGFSALLSHASSQRPEYQALNRLVLQGVWLMLEAWPGEPPKTIVIENVPRIVSRGSELLHQVRNLLTRAGYRLHEATHDCGEVGGLAQHRRRFLLVARLERRVAAFVYRPPSLRVRACGEVLDRLPLPLGSDGDVAGQMHRLPRLSWRTWVRLSLIRPGGDWRDLPTETAGVSLERTAERADTFHGRPGLMSVADWRRPTSAITGSASPTGSNGVAVVADPRIAMLRCRPRSGTYGVLDWKRAATTVTGSASVDNGTFAVADPRATPATAPVIRSRWDCWHRPLSTLELAALQGLPTVVSGEPLRLAGKSVSRWRERIGNAVPVGAAKAIGDSILTALIAGAIGTWTLGSTGIWVRHDGRSELEWQDAAAS